MKHEIFEIFQDAVVIIDKKRRPLFANTAFDQLIGIPLKRLTKKPLFSSVKFSTSEPFCAGGSWGMDTLTPYKEIGIEVHGEKLTVQLRITPLGKELWLVVMRDVSLEKSLQEKFQMELKEKEDALIALKATQEGLIQTEKMATVGELVAGISHELNNPLAIIVSSAEELRRQLESATPDLAILRRLVQHVNKGTDRVTKLSRHLRNFVHTPLDERNFVASDLTSVIEEAVGFCGHFLRKSKIKCTVDVPTGLARVMMDPNLIEQVLINLLKNASDAIVMSPQTVADPQIKIEVKAGAEKIQIAVIDNGPGIPEDVQKKIFNPFFTTKEVGKGTGLGLSICNEIAQRHGGKLLLHSEVGKGSKFILEVDKTGTNEKTGLLKGRRILVVEDEDSIRENVANALTKWGCEITAVNNGRVALEGYNSEYDLVLTDLAMPEMDGDRMAQAIWKIDPVVPIILVTGSALFRRNTPTNTSMFDAVVSKPFTQDELVRQILKVLRNSRRGRARTA